MQRDNVERIDTRAGGDDHGALVVGDGLGVGDRRINQATRVRADGRNARHRGQGRDVMQRALARTALDGRQPTIGLQFEQAALQHRNRVVLRNRIRRANHAQVLRNR